jgi:hypothetical protein
MKVMNVMNNLPRPFFSCWYISKVMDTQQLSGSVKSFEENRQSGNHVKNVHGQRTYCITYYHTFPSVQLFVITVHPVNKQHMYDVTKVIKLYVGYL